MNSRSRSPLRKIKERKERKEREDVLLPLLQFLQKNYQSLFVLLSETLIADPNCNIASSKMQCGHTSINMKTLLNCKQKVKDSRVNINIITMWGSYWFPDHQFLYIEYMDKIYILQSFYNVYIFSGKYGLQILENKEITEFLSLMSEYQKIYETKKVDVKSIKNLNTRFQKYTGVDLNKHLPFIRNIQKAGDIFYEHEEYHCTIDGIKENIYNILTFFIHKNKISPINVTSNFMLFVDSLLDISENPLKFKTKEEFIEKYLDRYTGFSKEQITGSEISLYKLDHVEYRAIGIEGCLTFTTEELIKVLNELFILLGYGDDIPEFKKSVDVKEVSTNIFIDWFTKIKNMFWFKSKSIKKKSIKKKSIKKKSIKKKSIKKKSIKKKSIKIEKIK
jgi:hypothetical protein